MSQVLRIIRKNRWSSDDSWLKNKNMDAPAEILSDFSTKNNELSFWIVRDDSIILNRLLATLAANRDELDHLDYLLFDEIIFQQAKIQTEFSLGDTVDQTVNQLHLAVKNLTVKQLADLAIFIWCSPTKDLNRHLQKELASKISWSAQNGYIDTQKLKPKLREAVFGKTER